MLIAHRVAGALTVAALSTLVLACAPVQAPGNATEAPTPGWYVQQEAGASFQPCAAEQRLEVVNGADLRRRAEDFGLQDGDPVYVRLLGSREDGEFRLSGVAQFGSPVPVRDCPMTGTTIQQ